MALKKQTEFKGITLPNTYIKITGFSSVEAETTAYGKIYVMKLFVNFYTDETKEYDICQKEYSFPVKLDGLTIENGYTLLKGLEEFSGAVDV